MLGASYIGFFLGAASGALLTSVLPAEAVDSWGWRVPFLIGGVFGFVSLYLRRQLDETPTVSRNSQDERLEQEVSTKSNSQKPSRAGHLRHPARRLPWDHDHHSLLLHALAASDPIWHRSCHGFRRQCARRCSAGLGVPTVGQPRRQNWSWLGARTWIPGPDCRSLPVLSKPGRDFARSRTIDLVDLEFFGVHVQCCRHPGALRTGLPDGSAIYRIWL